MLSTGAFHASLVSHTSDWCSINLDQPTVYSITNMCTPDQSSIFNLAEHSIIPDLA